MNVLRKYAGLGVATFTFVYWELLSRFYGMAPIYAGEINAARLVNWLSFWTWTDYSGYDRFSPFGALLVSVLDLRIIRPFVGASTSLVSGFSAEYLVQPYILLFAFLTFLVFRLLIALEVSEGAAIVGALFVGMHKGFIYYFGYAALIAVALLLVATVVCLKAFNDFLNYRQRRHLVIYLVAMIWAVGLWEQWMGLALSIFFFACCALVSTKVRGDWSRSSLVKWGMLYPFGLMSLYMIFRSQRLTETSTVSEAQLIFSYQSIWLMIEEVVVNATHRLGSTFESLFFPQPMLSAAVIQNLDPNEFNKYNATYTSINQYHYVSIADWYVGLVSGVCIALILVWVIWIFRRGTVVEARLAVIGILLTIFGMVEHLPVMYRSYFTLPGYASLLDYKQAISVVGAAILISTALNSWFERQDGKSKFQIVSVCSLIGWLAINNALKVLITVWMRN